MIEVLQYISIAGANHFDLWLKNLDAQAARKVIAATIKLGLGNTSNIKWFKGIGEIKLDWGPGYRIYLAKDGEKLIILFGGGTKKSQNSDIKQAIALHQEYKSQKAAFKKVNGKMRKE